MAKFSPIYSAYYEQLFSTTDSIDAIAVIKKQIASIRIKNYKIEKSSFHLGIYVNFMLIGDGCLTEYNLNFHNFIENTFNLITKSDWFQKLLVKIYQNSLSSVIPHGLINTTIVLEGTKQGKNKFSDWFSERIKTELKEEFVAKKDELQYEVDRIKETDSYKTKVRELVTRQALDDLLKECARVRNNMKEYGVELDSRLIHDLAETFVVNSVMEE